MAGKNDSVKNTSRIVLFLVGIVVLSALAYFAFKYFNEKQENDQNIARIAELDTEIAELEEKILSFEVTIEDQNMDLAEKDRQLSDKNTQIEELLQRLNKAKSDNKLSVGRVRQLEEKLNQMQRFINQYKGQIAVLTQEKDSLINEVAQLKESAKVVTESFTQLEEEQKETVEELEETKKIASVLKAANYNFYRIKGKKQKEIIFEGEEAPRSGMIGFKLCFEVMENLVADPGYRDIYMVLEDNEGQICASEKYSGYFQYEEINKQYSAMATFDYSRLTQQVCIPYMLEDLKKGKFNKGLYYVSLYSGGNLVGQTSFRLK